MPQVQICLYDLGDFTLEDEVTIYSNVDGYTTPIMGQQFWFVWQFAPPICPFFVIVPEGTTTLYITNYDGSSCVYMEVEDSNLCDTCDFGFSEFSSQTIGRISAGVLTASCQNNITDYVIGWYNQNNELVITSGEGDLFEYQYTQPSLGVASPLVPPGIYNPIIQQISLNGQTFGLGIDSINFTAGTQWQNNYVIATLDCLPELEVVVDPFRCSIPVSPDIPLSGYSHNVTYIGESSSTDAIPEVMPVHFILDEGTTHIAFAFRGVSVTDQVKIVYSGVNYDQPFILDWFNVGSQTTITNFDTFPTNIQLQPTSYLKKVYCLTGFTQIDYVNDKIIFEIIPNQFNSNTDWYLGFDCLSSFDCNNCFFTANTKVNLNSLTFSYSNLNTCNPLVGFKLNLSGCPYNTVPDTPIYKYFQSNSLGLSIPQTLIPPTGLKIGQIYSTLIPPKIMATLSPFGTYNSGDLSNVNLSCAAVNTDTITFSKTYNSGNQQATIFMTFETVNSLNHYYSSYLNALSMFDPNFTDNTEETYYEYYELNIPFNSNPNTPCGDSSVLNKFMIPKQATFQSALTPSNLYTLEITWTAPINNLSTTDCYYVTVQTALYGINSTLTQTTTINTNVGSRYNNPFVSFGYIVNPGSTAITLTEYFCTYRSLFETLPRDYSNPSILYPEYSGVTCPNIYSLPSQNGYYYNNYASFRLSLINSGELGDIEDHKLEKYVDGIGFVTVYNYSGGTFHDVDYTYAYQ